MPSKNDANDSVFTVLRAFLVSQMNAKPDNYGPMFVHACEAEALLKTYFSKDYSLELFRPDGYLHFARLLLDARVLDLVTPEQDDNVCAALGEIWDSLATPEQIELERKVARMQKTH